MISISTFSGSIGIKLTYSAGILFGIQNPSCVPFPHGVTVATGRRQFNNPSAPPVVDKVKSVWLALSRHHCTAVFSWVLCLFDAVSACTHLTIS